MALDMQIMSIVNAGWIGANDYVYRNEKEIFQSEFGEFLLAWRKRRERQ